MRRALITLVALLALLLLAACGTSSTASTSSSGTATAHAKSAVCQSLAAVEQALAQMATVTPTTTVGQMQTMQSNLTSALNQLAATIPGHNSNPIVYAVQTANDELGATLKTYPAATPLSQTSLNVNRFHDSIITIQGQATQYGATLNCNQ